MWWQSCLTLTCSNGRSVGERLTLICIDSSSVGVVNLICIDSSVGVIMLVCIDDSNIDGCKFDQGL